MYQRFTIFERFQHISLIIIIFVLILTGIPIKYHNFILTKYLIIIFGGIEMRAFLHRIFAICLIGICFLHLASLLLSEKSNKNFRAILPNKKDFKDIVQMLKFYIGLEKESPKFSKFNYWQKFQYLAISVTSLTMICSGSVLWFENYTVLIFPKVVLDLALVIHSYQATLIFILVMILHLYNVHLNPDFFPINKLFLTGKISKEELKKFHPLEYEEKESL